MQRVTLGLEAPARTSYEISAIREQSSDASGSSSGDGSSGSGCSAKFSDLCLEIHLRKAAFLKALHGEVDGPR